MKAKTVRLTPHDGYEDCAIEEATHLKLNIPGPTGVITLPVITSGRREGTGSWSWNGSLDAPSLRPSVASYGYDNKLCCSFKCHSWITDGKVQFLSDSTHAMVNTSADLLDVD